ncbi:MAG: hypothetical protein AB1630_08860 [bacterium]
MNEQIKRWLKNGTIVSLKKGFYTSRLYYLKEPNKRELLEFLANRLRFPSYLSGEYILSQYSLLTEATYPLTSITLKATRAYNTPMGTFRYMNIKQSLFLGFTTKPYGENLIYLASKAKSLFDLLYLKTTLRENPKEEIQEGLRINWDEFKNTDLIEFKNYVDMAQSKKMFYIFDCIKGVLNASL